MTYNFDKIVQRKNTSSIKWDAESNADLLPMWVADMDFETAPEIVSAIKKRVDHGVFGYSLTPDEFNTSIQYWWKKRHQLDVDPSWILPSTGIIPALIGIINAFCEKEDEVLLLTPVYDHFFSCIENCDCKAIESNLNYENGVYTINFEDLEEKASRPSVKLIILSNPHNPAGRVWTAKELKQIGDICLKHNIKVVSDEIHSDLIFPGHKHTPFASLGKTYSDISITCCSPSKTFNLAGLQVGYVFTSNPTIKNQIEKAFHKQEMFLVSPFASTALIAAYQYGEAWMEGLISYLYDNYLFLKSFVETELPQIQITPLEGTYLVWLNLSAYSIDSEKFCEKLKAEQKLWLNSGHLYGQAGEGFVRMNIACARPLLVDGLNRLKKQLDTL